MIIGYMLIAGLGGFVGTFGRYLTGVAGKKLFGDKYPVGTFAVNVIGCFIIGIFVGLWTRHEMSPLVNALLISGFCGGFTTFSSFADDMWVLGQKGDWATFGIYLALSVVCGILCVWAGRAIIR